jgi:penicillin-binding protein 2
MYFKNKKITVGFKEDIEPHEVLLDSLAKKREEELGFSEHRIEVPLLKKILQVFFVVCFLIILLLFAKTFQFQIVEGKKFSQLAEENQFIINQIQAERGVIYDKNLKQLVFNLPSFDLVCEKTELPESESEKEEVLKKITQILEIDLEEMKRQIEESEESKVLVFEDLEHQTLLVLETRAKEFSGFSIRQNSVREYWRGPTFSHLIGYTGKIRREELEANPGVYSILDYVGREGLEKYYEKTLRKNSGELRIERDALGNIISREVTSLPESGESLVLWLDSDLQIKLKEELERILQGIGTKKAVAVAMDPKTGGILAMVSLPDFDNNLFQKGADMEELEELLRDPYNLQPLFNRVISGQYLTGSTIKPFIASAVLEEEIISPQKKINCQGLITIPNPYNLEEVTTKDDWTVHGLTDMRKAIAESCNVYFYTVGGGYGDQEGLGPTRIKEYLELFGWGEKTGVDLPAEVAGFLPDKEWKREVLNEGWWDGDTYNLSIGQGYLLITPLEVVNAFSVIANGGTLFQPHVVKEIVDKEKNVVEEIKPEIIRQGFIDPQNFQVVREGMRQAVSGINSSQASAVFLSSLPVAAAAKTGTAELGKNIYHNWLTVFAPYDDPEIVLTVMFESVEGVQAVALPAAKTVLNWYFTR